MHNVYIHMWQQIIDAGGGQGTKILANVSLSLVLGLIHQFFPRKDMGFLHWYHFQMSVGFSLVQLVSN